MRCQKMNQPDDILVAAQVELRLALENLTDVHANISDSYMERIIAQCVDVHMHPTAPAAALKAPEQVLSTEASSDAGTHASTRDADIVTETQETTAPRVGANGLDKDIIQVSELLDGNGDAERAFKARTLAHLCSQCYHCYVPPSTMLRWAFSFRR